MFTFTIDFSHFLPSAKDMLARVFSSAIKGLDGVVVEVEVDTGQGLLSIILAHNHPSGDPIPVPDNVSHTRHVKEAADLLDIQADHIVVRSNHDS